MSVSIIDNVMSAAWSGFLMWAIRQPEIRAAFTADTGRTMDNPQSPLESMIDKATGKDADDAMAFAVWATRTQWGWDMAPASFQVEGEAWERAQSEKSRPEGKE